MPATRLRPAPKLVMRSLSCGLVIFGGHVNILVDGSREGHWTHFGRPERAWSISIWLDEVDYNLLILRRTHRELQHRLEKWYTRIASKHLRGQASLCYSCGTQHSPRGSARAQHRSDVQGE